MCQLGEGGDGGGSDYSKWPPPTTLLDIAKLPNTTFGCHVVTKITKTPSKLVLNSYEKGKW